MIMYEDEIIDMKVNPRGRIAICGANRIRAATRLST